MLKGNLSWSNKKINYFDYKALKNNRKNGCL